MKLWQYIILFWLMAYLHDKLFFLCRATPSDVVRQQLELSLSCVGSRVARWYIFRPKITIWVNYGGPWNRNSWNS
jgi:hypothetical protein